MRVGETARSMANGARLDRSPSNSVNRSLARASRRTSARRSTSSSRARDAVADVLAGADPGPQLADAVLGGGDRELGVGQAVGVGVHVASGRRAERTAGGDEVGDPARLVARGRGPQVAAGHGDERGRRRRDGGEELAVHGGGPLVGALQPGQRPLVVADQRVDDGRRRDEPVGGTEHDGDVDVEAGGHRRACSRARRRRPCPGGPA